MLESNRLSDEQRAALDTMQRVLKTLLSHNRTMHLPVAQTFLRVAADEGKSIGEHARMLSITDPGMSKMIADMGELNRRRHKPGLDLVETRRSLISGRRREAFLTYKGRALAHMLIHELRRGPRAT
ncbi:hypothetical protein UB31_00490 [Bradyrhizobium sp. LTSP849]|uniref:hypothetical protein n=1 Tax=Bradyrhizobium sp. LTSP849 TaxID=1615890 RepID=UPI0005E4BE5E|nr:hypothetical protein [Bradyrhizobium sp. LTSP849]KJC55492.1 hypothetical protein UB31_00490 [Bradyrhizobium sp. LTSP849]